MAAGRAGLSSNGVNNSSVGMATGVIFEARSPQLGFENERCMRENSGWLLLLLHYVYCNVCGMKNILL